jgi:hypothetical protein
MSIRYCEYYPESVTKKEDPVQWNSFLKLMRIGHAILGITAPPPEHERAYLLDGLCHFC